MAVIFAVPILRDFYELDVLSPMGYLGCMAAVVVWAVLLKAFWAAGLHVPLRKLGMTGIDATAVTSELARRRRRASKTSPRLTAPLSRIWRGAYAAPLSPLRT